MIRQAFNRSAVLNSALKIRLQFLASSWRCLEYILLNPKFDFSDPRAGAITDIFFKSICSISPPVYPHSVSTLTLYTTGGSTIQCVQLEINALLFQVIPKLEAVECKGTSDISLYLQKNVAIYTKAPFRTNSVTRGTDGTTTASHTRCQ